MPTDRRRDLQLGLRGRLGQTDRSTMDRVDNRRNLPPQPVESEDGCYRTLLETA